MGQLNPQGGATPIYVASGWMRGSILLVDEVMNEYVVKDPFTDRRYKIVRFGTIETTNMPSYELAGQIFPEDELPWMQ